MFGLFSSAHQRAPLLNSKEALAPRPTLAHTIMIHSTHVSAAVRDWKRLGLTLHTVPAVGMVLLLLWLVAKLGFTAPSSLIISIDGTWTCSFVRK